MTLPEENLGQLSDILCIYVYDNDIDTSTKNTLDLDEELQLSELSLDTIKSLEKLAPFGMDNKKPVFWLHDITVTQARTMGQNGAHLKFKVTRQGIALTLSLLIKVICFKISSKLKILEIGGNCLLMFGMDINYSSCLKMRV